MSGDARSARPDARLALVELRLLLWHDPEGGWHARLIGPHADTHDFATPLELARFVGRSNGVDAVPGTGLR